ncbi:MAG TPA: hypothetical protein VGO52_07820 [Hyphomonadaceae bacterium]|nr:hypothetical protein [Hyphomonadaceae bacterium]
MRGIVLIGALALLCSACQPKEETPATVELPASTAPAAPAPATDAASYIGLEFAQAVARFDPTQNHIIWATPPGVHGEGPWTLDVTVKYKGEVKHAEKIPLKADIAAAGSVADIPAGYEAVRLSDGGTFRARMAEIQKIIEGIIAQYGRGGGELVMMTEINTALDDAGMKTYCADKKTPDIRAYLEETAPPKLTAIDLKPMGEFMQKEVEENCPK